MVYHCALGSQVRVVGWSTVILESSAKVWNIGPSVVTSHRTVPELSWTQVTILDHCIVALLSWRHLTLTYLIFQTNYF